MRVYACLYGRMNVCVCVFSCRYVCMHALTHAPLHTYMDVQLPCVHI